MKQEHNNFKQTNPSPEELFSVSTKTNLTASEQAHMWENLSAYATFHTKAEIPNTQTTNRSIWSHFSYLYTGLTALLLLTFGTGIGSSYSLPGEFLYPVKTQVTEPLLGAFQFTDTEQLEYLSDIIDTRLNEMKTLSEINQLNELKIRILEEQIAEDSQDIVEILTETDTQKHTVETKESVALLSEILLDIQTQEYLENITVSPSRTSKIEEAADTLNDLYLTELKDFSEEEPDEVTVYIESILDEIDTYITDTTESPKTSIEMRDYLEDVSTALEEKNLEQALIYSSEAKQSLQLDAQIESLEEPTDETE